MASKGGNNMPLNEGKRNDRQIEIYCGNLPSSITENEISDIFKDYKNVRLLRLFKRELKTFCFLSCGSVKNVAKVVRGVNKAEVHGRFLCVRASDESVQKRILNNDAFEDECDDSVEDCVLDSEDQSDNHRNRSRRKEADELAADFHNMTIVPPLKPISLPSDNRYSSINSPPPPLKPVEQCAYEHVTHKSPDVYRLPTCQYENDVYKMPSARCYANEMPPSYVPHHRPIPHAQPHLNGVIENGKRPMPAKYSGYGGQNHMQPPMSRGQSHMQSPMSRGQNHMQSNMSTSRNRLMHDNDRAALSHHAQATFSSPPESHSSQAGDEEEAPVILLVSNFPYWTSDEEIYDLFDDFEPLAVWMLSNEPGSITEAYVAVPDEKYALNAVMTLDNTQYRRRVLIVMDVTDTNILSELQCFDGYSR